MFCAYFRFWEWGIAKAIGRVLLMLPVQLSPAGGLYLKHYSTIMFSSIAKLLISIGFPALPAMSLNAPT